MLKDQLIAFALLLPFLGGAPTAVSMNPPLGTNNSEKKPVTQVKNPAPKTTVPAQKAEPAKTTSAKKVENKEQQPPATKADDKKLPPKTDDKKPVTKEEEKKSPVKEEKPPVTKVEEKKITPKTEEKKPATQKAEEKQPPKQEAKPPVTKSEEKKSPTTTQKQEEKLPVTKPEVKKPGTEQKTTPPLPTGETQKPVPVYTEVTVGSGVKVATGERAVFHFAVADAQGKEFVNSKKRGLPFTVEASPTGAELWDVLLKDMRVGGIRKMSLTPEQVNAGKGLPPYVPAGVPVTVTVWLLRSEK